MARLLGDEYTAFAEALTLVPVHGLRVNTLKLSADEFRDISPFPLGAKVPWCDSAYSILPAPSRGNETTESSEPGKHAFHMAGLYYLQDPSAMSAAVLLNPQPGERVLDLAASPGGKATQIASLMHGKGLLVANEIKTKRLNHLVFNVERWGAGNVVVTNETPERLADHFGAWFDRVLVDAPCSGEGMFRKDMGARLAWSEEMVMDCAVRQVNILRVAAHLVRPGGALLYSTCTFAPEEDEAVVVKFLKDHLEFEVESLPQLPGFMPGRPDWVGLGTEANALHGAVRLFPHRVRGDGHFACLLKRKDGASKELEAFWEHEKVQPSDWKLWEAFREQTLELDFPAERLRLQGDRLYYLPEEAPDMKGLRVAVPGICLGNLKKDRFEPAHPLAVFLRPGQARNELSLPANSSEMAAYFRGDSLPAEGPPGWILVTADGWPLGWGKRVQGRVKNHFPAGWQIYS